MHSQSRDYVTLTLCGHILFQCHLVAYLWSQTVLMYLVPSCSLSLVTVCSGVHNAIQQTLFGHNLLQYTQCHLVACLWSLSVLSFTEHHCVVSLQSQSVVVYLVPSCSCSVSEIVNPEINQTVFTSILPQYLFYRNGLYAKAVQSFADHLYSVSRFCSPICSTRINLTFSSSKEEKFPFSIKLSQQIHTLYTITHRQTHLETFSDSLVGFSIC